MIQETAGVISYKYEVINWMIRIKNGMVDITILNDSISLLSLFVTIFDNLLPLTLPCYFIFELPHTVAIITSFERFSWVTKLFSKVQINVSVKNVFFVRVCVCACVRACARARVCVCTHVNYEIGFFYKLVFKI